MRRGSAQGGDVAAESGKGKTWATSFKELQKAGYLWLCRMTLSYTNERFHLELKQMSRKIFIPRTLCGKGEVMRCLPAAG